MEVEQDVKQVVIPLTSLDFELGGTSYVALQPLFEIDVQLLQIVFLVAQKRIIFLISSIIIIFLAILVLLLLLLLFLRLLLILFSQLSIIGYKGINLIVLEKHIDSL